MMKRRGEMGWKSRKLSPFQDRNTVTITVEWDIPLWDKARQVAIGQHMSLSTLVWQAMKAYLDDKELPAWGRVRDPEEHKHIANWKVERMAQLDEAVKTGVRPKRELSRVEEHYLETQALLKKLSKVGRPVEG
jgi:hypothetical protein